MTAFQTAMFVVGCVFTVLTCAGVVVVGVGVISAKLRDDLEPETLGSAYRKGYVKGRLDADSERLVTGDDDHPAAKRIGSAYTRGYCDGYRACDCGLPPLRIGVALSSTQNEETTPA